MEKKILKIFFVPEKMTVIPSKLAKPLLIAYYDPTFLLLE